MKSKKPNILKGMGLGKGWKGESVRHGLASRGIPTGRKTKPKHIFSSNIFAKDKNIKNYTEGCECGGTAKFWKWDPENSSIPLLKCNRCGDSFDADESVWREKKAKDKWRKITDRKIGGNVSIIYQRKNITLELFRDSMWGKTENMNVIVRDKNLKGMSSLGRGISVKHFSNKKQALKYAEDWMKKNPKG